MKISTKGQYALLMLLDLAMNNTGEYITIKSIAGRQSLPEKYLEQIMTILSKSGFVKSVRGSKGGYKLADKPENFTVGMILRAIEGDLSPVNYVDNNQLHLKTSVISEVWEQLDEAINQVVDNITLENLVQKEQDRIGNDYII